MDPTKPILDLYGDSFYSIRDRQQRPQNYKSSTVTTYNNPAQNTSSKYNRTQPQPQKRNQQQPSYSQLEDKYQELYQAYKEKSSKLSQLEEENDHIKNENTKLRNQVDRLIGKNQEINSAMLTKNLQLEEVYRKLQDQIRGGRAVRGGLNNNEGAIDKLEDGLREAINSNYQILRESALAQLKQFMTQ